MHVLDQEKEYRISLNAVQIARHNIVSRTILLRCPYKENYHQLTFMQDLIENDPDPGMVFCEIMNKLNHSIF